jgi:S1-C subfamily serine protease
VADVIPGSPAARAALLTGDIILEMDGAPAKDSRDLSSAVGAKLPGTAVRLKAFRGERDPRSRKEAHSPFDSAVRLPFVRSGRAEVDHT